MSFAKVIATAIIAVLVHPAVGPSATAGTISYADSFTRSDLLNLSNNRGIGISHPGQPGIPTVGPTTTTEGYSLEKFDSSLGALTAVSISVVQDISAPLLRHWAVDDGTPGNSWVSIIVGGATGRHDQRFTLGVGSLSHTSAIDHGESATSCSAIQFGCAGSAIGANTELDETLGYSAPADLANFIGNDQFGITALLDVTTTSSCNSGADCSAAYSIASWSGTAIVTYTFVEAAQIPGPGPGWLMAVGLAFFAGARRLQAPAS